MAIRLATFGLLLGLAARGATHARPAPPTSLTTSSESEPNRHGDGIGGRADLCPDDTEDRDGF